MAGSRFVQGVQLDKLERRVEDIERALHLLIEQLAPIIARLKEEEEEIPCLPEPDTKS